MLLESSLLAFVVAVIAVLPEDDGAVLVWVGGLAAVALLATIDVRSRRVPNSIVYPALVFVLAGSAAVDASFLDEAAAGGAVCFAIMFMVALAGRGSMGMGDVKFSTLSGVILGWKGGLVALAGGLVVGGVAALGLILLGLKHRKDSLPLTPFLSAGVLAALLAYGPILETARH